MKKLYLALSMMLALGVVGACSDSNTKPQTETPEEEMTSELVTEIKEPVTIEFWHAMSGANGEVVESMVRTFNESIGSEKNITVEPVFQGSYNDLKSKTTAAIKANQAPVIAQSYADWVAEYLQSDAVVSLNDYINHETVGVDNFEDIMEAYRAENSSYGNGTFYSLPFNKSSEVLYYNKTFFDENNLMVPTTWEEVESVSKMIYEMTDKPGLGLDSAQNYIITAIHQLGGDYTNANGDILFDNEATMKALELIDRNVDAGYWRLVGEDKFMSGPFLNELTYMYTGSTAGSEFLKDATFEWAAAPYPQFEGMDGAVIQQGTNVVMFNQDKSPEEIYAGYEFMKYLVSEEANTYLATNSGYLPIRESVMNSETYQDYASNSTDSTKLVVLEQSDLTFYDPAFFNEKTSSYNIRTEVGNMVENVVVNGKTPQEAIEEAKQALE